MLHEGVLSRKSNKMTSVSCSICWDIVTSTCVVSYLACGHVYHHHCLDKWLKTSSTCPECRNFAVNAKRIYLNLVPDPEIEDLNVELSKRNKEYEFLQTSYEIQDAIIKQLDKEMSTKLVEKDEALMFSQQRNDELKLTMTSMQHLNDKLNLELQMQEKQQSYLTNEVTELKTLLAVSQTKNMEITNSTVTLKEYYREQVKQISDLHSEILNLTERLDQFRGQFVAADSKLQAQLQENELIKNERDTLLNQNSQLVNKVDNLKLQVDNQLSRKIRQKYEKLSSSVGTFQSRRKLKFEYLHKKKEMTTFGLNHLTKEWHRSSSDSLKIKLVKSKLSSQNHLTKNWHPYSCSDSLKIKLVKSKLSWVCVKS